MLLKKSAMLISMLAHPAILPTVFFLIITNTTKSFIGPIEPESKFRLILMIFITTFILPVLVVYINMATLKKRLSIKVLFLENRKDRIFPMFYTGIFYAGVTYMLYDSGKMNNIIVWVMAIISGVVVLTGAISYFWKISAHSVGISGLVVSLMVLKYLEPDSRLDITIIILILVSGLVASSRLYLRSHTPNQIFAGVLLGASSGLLLLLFL